MKRYIPAMTLLSCTSILWGTDYAFLNEDAFVSQNHLWHFESDFSLAGGAKVTNSDVYGSKLHYAEGNASMYFSHFLNNENALTWQVGANFVNIDWAQNPRFTGKDYIYGITSLSWISNSIEKWRWVINGGLAVDTNTWNFGKSAVYFTTLWGRYQHKPNLGFHIGFFAYYGALNGYVLPILGLDWWMSPKWELRGVFPIDVSLSYHFAKNFTSSIVVDSMGGPYRFPRRAKDGIGSYEDGIFKIYSTTVEGNLKFHLKDRFSIGAGGGWDFGGWMQVSDSNSHNKNYYDFDGSPFGRVFATLTF